MGAGRWSGTQVPTLVGSHRELCTQDCTSVKLEGKHHPSRPRGREAAGRARHRAGQPAPSCAAKGRAMGQDIIPGPQTASLWPSGDSSPRRAGPSAAGRDRVLSRDNVEGPPQVTKVEKAGAERNVVCVVKTHTRREKIHPFPHVRAQNPGTGKRQEFHTTAFQRLDYRTALPVQNYISLKLTNKGFLRAGTLETGRAERSSQRELRGTVVGSQSGCPHAASRQPSALAQVRLPPPGPLLLRGQVPTCPKVHSMPPRKSSS